jgi:hypothetical protein
VQPIIHLSKSKQKARSQSVALAEARGGKAVRFNLRPHVSESVFSSTTSPLYRTHFRMSIPFLKNFIFSFSGQPVERFRTQNETQIIRLIWNVKRFCDFF